VRNLSKREEAILLIAEGYGVKFGYFGDNPPCTKLIAEWDKGDEDVGSKSVFGGPMEGCNGSREVVV
jgi:hypothetical protein